MVIIIPILILLLLVRFFLFKIYDDKSQYETKVTNTHGFVPYTWTMIVLSLSYIIANIIWFKRFPPIFILGATFFLIVLYFFEKHYIPHTNKHKVTGWIALACFVLLIVSILLFSAGYI